MRPNRRARLRAREKTTSLSAPVRSYPNRLGDSETEAEALAREEKALGATVGRFSAADRSGRDAIHERRT